MIKWKLIKLLAGASALAASLIIASPAGASIGADYIVKSVPDGYIVLTVGPSFAILSNVVRNLS